MRNHDRQSILTSLQHGLVLILLGVVLVVFSGILHPLTRLRWTLINFLLCSIDSCLLRPDSMRTLPSLPIGIPNRLHNLPQFLLHLTVREPDRGIAELS